jgi:hypothetical protein
VGGEYTSLSAGVYIEKWPRTLIEIHIQLDLNCLNKVVRVNFMSANGQPECDGAPMIAPFCATA